MADAPPRPRHGYFNPRSREGSDTRAPSSLDCLGISIHAPVKGATRGYRRAQGAPAISIHAPVKGATCPGRARRSTRPYFNPRSREGSDLDASEYRAACVISIHAPVKGATSPGAYGQQPGGISIHAPVKGATTSGRVVGIIDGISIHAPVKGATRWTARSAAWTPYFNPRSREGSDHGPHPQRCRRKISIHAPVKGATRIGRHPVAVPGISIHAPVKGATFISADIQPAYQISIHAPVKGATTGTGHRPCAERDFNPRSREGSDGQRIPCVLLICISIHAPVKGATAQ